jgi:hypothetical protein
MLINRLKNFIRAEGDLVISVDLERDRAVPFPRDPAEWERTTNVEELGSGDID